MSNKIGLVSYQGDESGIKPYSEGTNEIIDEEIKVIVDKCYQETKDLLMSKKELIEK